MTTAQTYTFNPTSRKLASLIEQSNGKFFNVTFVKKDGSIRTMNARLGVEKYLKGGKKTVSEQQFVTVYEPATSSYKNINRDTIMAVRSAGIEAVAVSATKAVATK